MLAKIKLFTAIIGLSLLLSTSPYAETEPARDKKIPMEEVQRFSNALSQIKKYYVRPIDDKELFENAIKGMVGGLDPHSGYLNEEDFNELQDTTTGEFGGLGIEVTMEDGLLKVITPLVDTPAFKAGIKSGDYIVKIGPKAVQGMDLKDAVNLMRGAPGSLIELTILRKGEKKPMIVSLAREKILIKSVKSKLYDNKFGYVRLTQFQAATNKDLVIAIETLKKESGGKLKGLILDLRNNPGGLLDSAIEVSDNFLDKDQEGKVEKIVYTQGRLPGTQFTAFSTPGDLLENAPIIVLINNGSASAAEIVAGALKDNKRAVILGTQSFGKGSVQTVIPLDDKRGIKLTTALYYTPLGTSIQAKGITPDIVVEEVPITKEEKEKVSFSEESLNGHLLNTTETKTVTTTTSADIKQPETQDEADLMYNDYQLYTALTILKGLAIANR